MITGGWSWVQLALLLMSYGCSLLGGRGGCILAWEPTEAQLTGEGNDERLVLLEAVGKGPSGDLPEGCLGAFSHSSAADLPRGESMTGRA